MNIQPFSIKEHFKPTPSAFVGMPRRRPSGATATRKARRSHTHQQNTKNS
jgi:hypothetical protein